MLLIDDFLPEGDLKTSMESEELWKESLPLSWYECGKEIKDYKEQFCQHVWTNYFFTNKPVEITGWEYWSHSMNAKGDYKDLGFHVDSDIYQQLVSEEVEQQMIAEGKAKVPKHGFIYYAHKELPEGGYLEVKREHGDLERIQPVPNRLIIFDPSCIHRVTRVTKGVRRSLVCNLWKIPPRWVIEKGVYDGNGST